MCDKIWVSDHQRINQCKSICEQDFCWVRKKWCCLHVGNKSDFWKNVKFWGRTCGLGSRFLAKGYSPCSFMLVWGALAVRQQCVVSSGHGLSAETCLDAIAAGDPMEDRCRQPGMACGLGWWQAHWVGNVWHQHSPFESDNEAQSLGVSFFFKWQWSRSFQIFQVAMNSCALARQGQLVNELQALASRQSRGLQAAAGIMSLALHNALSSQCWNEKFGKWSTLGWASVSQVQWRPIPQKLRPPCAKLLAVSVCDSLLVMTACRE